MSPAPHLFNRKTVKCFFDGDNLSIFDFNPSNALLFSQGDWSLIRRDLSYAGVDESMIQALERGPCADMIQAFRIRRELIHYKKVCLHLFEEAKKIERDLKQVMAFFFWDDGVDKREGCKAHLEALIPLAESDLNEEVSPLDIDAVKIAMAKHESKDWCELVYRKVMYVLATGAWSFHKGVSLALYDARNIAKTICLSPRHPEGERKNMKKNKKTTSMLSTRNRLEQNASIDAKLDFDILAYVGQAVKKFEEKDPDGSRCDGFQRVQDISAQDGPVSKENGTSRITTSTSTSGCESLDQILLRARNELLWPSEAVDFLSLSIVARGGFKALKIVQELQQYNHYMSLLPERLNQALEQHKRAHSEMIAKLLHQSIPSDAEEVLSSAVARLSSIHNLSGMFKVCNENAKWISRIASLSFNDENCHASRLFVAGDDARKNNTCIFVPKDFELGTFIAYTRQLLDKVLLPTMKSAIAAESWPPTQGSKRTRVLAFDNSTIENLLKKPKGLQICKGCNGHFDAKKWIRKQMCVICEAAKREYCDHDRCYFEDCKFASLAFCPHYQRCFVCDAPHSCEEFCLLSRGNGEVAAALVETLRPELLLLDFDRTLASTKSGASPLPKKGAPHSIDVELKDAVIAQRAYGLAHVVTRNSHKTEIEIFLKLHNLDELAKNVHVVPKKKTKGSYIKETFFPNNRESKKCIFIDDDIRELVKDSWLRSANVHRFLFVRAML